MRVSKWDFVTAQSICWKVEANVSAIESFVKNLAEASVSKKQAGYADILYL